MRESREKAFKRWNNRIEVGCKWIKDQKKEWDWFREAYLGNILTPEKSDFNGDIASVNLQYVDVRSSIPKLYAQNPYVYIDPDHPSADVQAEVMEKVVNSLKEKRWHLKKRVREVLKAAKLDGRAYLKISYKFNKDKIGREYVGDEPNDEISINVVLRKDLIIPRDCTSVDNARWVAHRVTDQVGNIRKKFKLRPDDKIADIEEDNYVKNSTMEDEEKEDFRSSCYYEIEDRVNRELKVIVNGVDRWAVPPYPFPYEFYTMYVPFEWNDIPGDNDTKADLHFWKRLLMQLAEEETMRVNHARKLNAKYVHKGNKKLSDEQIADIESYKDSQIVHLDIGESLEPFQHATLGQEHYLGSQTTRQDITIISGMNEMKQGLPQSKKTAREAMAIVAESQDITTDRAVLIEERVAEVIEKCISLIQTNYDTTRVIAISGMEEAEFLGLQEKFKSKDGKRDLLQGTSKSPFISFVGSQDLLGKMSVRIKAGSALPVNEAQRKQDFAELIQMAGSNQIVAAAMDPKEALKELSKLLHIENKRIIIDPKSPKQENVLLKRNIPVMPHWNEPHDQHIAAHEMENNASEAFINHILAHKLMKSHVEGSRLQAQQPPQVPQGPGGLSQENISGLPMGSSVPPSAMPQQGRAVSPPQNNQPKPSSGALPI